MTIESTSEGWEADAPPRAARGPGCGLAVIAIFLATVLGSGFGLIVSYLLRKLGV